MHGVPAGDAKRGHQEIAEAVRAAGYKGLIIWEYPVWSVDGKHLARRPNGQFTGRPDYFVDMVLEQTAGAARAGRHAEMIGVEIDGKEHKHDRSTRAADNSKEDIVKFKLFRIKVDQVEDEGGGDWYTEALRLVDSVAEV